MNFKSWLKLFVLVGIACFTTSMFATGFNLDNPIPATRFFDMSPNDISMEMLGYIFGDVDGILPNDQPTIFGQIFQVFNNSVLVLGVIVMAYTLVIATINTAHEGTFMGQKYSSTWIPLRTIGGTGLLVPTPSGYSTIQIFTMWIIAQGVAAADTMWNTVLNYYNDAGYIVGGSGYSSTSGSTNFKVQNAENFAQNLLHTVTCQYLFINWAKVECNVVWLGPAMNNCVNPVSVGDLIIPYSNLAGNSLDYAPFAPTPPNSSVSTTYMVGYNYGNHGSDAPYSPGESSAACGIFAPTVTYSSTSGVDQQLAQAAVNAQLKGIDDARGKMEHCVARAFWDWAQNDQDPASAAQSVVQQLPGCNTILSDAIDIYNADLNAGILAALNANSPADQEIQQWIALVKERGWMDAGSYYLELSNSPAGGLYNQITQPPLYNSQQDNQYLALLLYYDNAIFNGECDNGGWIGTAGCNWNGKAWRRGFDAFSSVGRQHETDIWNVFAKNAWNPSANSNVIALQMNVPTASTYNDQFQNMMQNTFGKIGQAIVSGLISVLTGYQDAEDMLQQDPIINLRDAGVTLVFSMELVYFTIVVLVLGIILALSAGDIFTTDLVIGFSTILMMLLPFVLGFIGIIWVYAATMAYYVPMIPYILFLIGGIGWMVGVLESMVAAPLVALGLVVPSQEELGKAGHAIMLITNLFLRPSLMIVGFVGGMFFIRIGLYLLNQSFLSVLSVNAGAISVFGSAAVMSLYIGLMLFIIHKAFGLIHEIPDKVLRWIGSTGQEQFGEAQGLQEVKQGAERGAQRGGEMAKGAGKAVSKKAGATSESAKEALASKKSSGGGQGKT